MAYLSFGEIFETHNCLRQAHARLVAICSGTTRFRLSRFFYYPLIVLLCAYFLALSAHAEDAEKQESSRETLDAILVLDASASMRITDPDRLRDEGAKLFSQFLKEGDRLAIIEFDARARVLRSLDDYHPIQIPEIEKVVEKVSDVGVYTDPVSGIVEAKKLLDENPRSGAKKAIILLSDGKLDPDPQWATPEGLRDGLMYKLLPELKRQNITLHTLALSPEADKDLLAEMAQATGGYSWYSESPEGVHEAFTELFLVVKKPQIVPMTTKGFAIDADVQQATFYVNLEQGHNPAEALSVRTPSGYVYSAENLGSGMKWFATKQFEVITVDKPEVGKWQIIGLEEDEGFATVLTDLKLITDWPSSLLAGTKRVLKARLYDRDKPVVLPEMTSVTTYAFQITPTDRVSQPIISELLKDDGEGEDERPDDGVFSALVELDTPGDYQLKLLAKSPTFERQQTIPFRLKPRLINLSVVPIEQVADVSVGRVGGLMIDHFRVTLNPEVSALSNITIRLIAVDEQQELIELPIQRHPDGGLRYEVSSSELLVPGTYQIQASITGETRKGIVRGTSQVVRYERTRIDVERDKPPLAESKEDAVEESSVPSLLLSLLVGLVCLGTAGGCYFVLKNKKQPEEDDVPSFEVDSEITKAMLELQAAAEVSELDANDPALEGMESEPIEAETSVKEVAEEASGEVSQETSTEEEGESSEAVEESSAEEAESEEETSEQDIPETAQDEPTQGSEESDGVQSDQSPESSEEDDVSQEEEIEEVADNPEEESKETP